MSGRTLSNKFFTMMKALSNPKKNSVSYAQKRTSNAKLIKCVKIAHFFFPCYVRTVRNVYLKDFKSAYAVLHLIKKIKNHWVRGAKQDLQRFTKLWNFNFQEKESGSNQMSVGGIW